MTVEIAVLIKCDVSECTNRYDSGAERASLARSWAKSDGWKYAYGNDYCPDHAFDGRGRKDHGMINQEVTHYGKRLIQYRERQGRTQRNIGPSPKGKGASGDRSG